LRSWLRRRRDLGRVGVRAAADRPAVHAAPAACPMSRRHRGPGCAPALSHSQGEHHQRHEPADWPIGSRFGRQWSHRAWPSSGAFSSGCRAASHLPAPNGRSQGPRSACVSIANRCLLRPRVWLVACPRITLNGPSDRASSRASQTRSPLRCAEPSCT
jgi:hypothetical protein